MAQTSQTTLDQLKLIQQFAGNWQYVHQNNDTVDLMEIQQYGKVIFKNDYSVINGKRSALRAFNLII